MSVLDAALELEPVAVLRALQAEQGPISISHETSKVDHVTAPLPVLLSSTPSAEAVELSSMPTAGKGSLRERVPTPAPSAPSDQPAEPTLSRRYQRIYLATSVVGSAVIGWSDGSTGPLILRMESNYNASIQIGYTVVFLLFIAAFGYGLAALVTVPLTDRLDFGKVVVLGSILQLVAFAVEAGAPPWPVFVVAYSLNGFAVAIMGAQVNAFVACLPGGNWKLQLLHAGYGVGAFISPLAATQFAQATHWSFQYLIAGCLSVVEIILFCVIFRFRTQSQLLHTPPSTSSPDGGNKYRQILRLRLVHLFSFFILVYVGLEVSIGGWIVTYLVQIRGAGPSAGYVRSGFWGGLAMGRLLLIWVNEKLGVKRVIFLYLGLAFALEFVVWFVPNAIGDAVAVSVIGLLLGPFYPWVVGTGQRLFPAWLLTGCIGWIASFGQAGSAVFPFLTGALAQKYGIQVLQPVLVAMIVAEAAIWSVIPLGERRTD
ncbi:MFS general substrate transporter [Dacryopinax primogenitus]|uniref:MFS general substrate transporter n=1 Tax=Dacryopinax primogenitus (strain DJM 731) TaxID=1858805 RepID=M5GF44_DACPD|nr:MFS general substrate transporter [Dacryopinax primogenitus]EJU05957.1 MFS general substrate transporter [Dacryopinax primogenitus]